MDYTLQALAYTEEREMLRLQQPPEWVVRDGKVLVRNQMQRDLVNQ